MGMLMNTKGQVTVPAEIRAEFGWQAGDEFEFYTDENGKVYLKPVDDDLTKGERFVRRIYGKGTANMDKTTDELMAMLRGDD
ncbi:AbrB/MazE/SpoVT family DNA-binding domain-containing protein [Glycomyces albidus]|uniref:AbrB/MazE/SpoVT family DNA-binding domain-containing protein n=1 Tax=Glycomyces albidus TaxID=2656774 RepID=A0A6L5G6S7_9ACTN|nr:AbrB/MazE/SpoVT family DNA-binding domain-containing protein [Glycomyces albidus]MQM25349.1 AbrB/MazE/SpoVT family DNA-binding domain-containing protein [Glycomyces albidus]